MQTDRDIGAMVRDLRENGFDAAQGDRFDFAFGAAKVAAVAILCAKYGTPAGVMLHSLRFSRNLAAEAGRWVARIEVSPEFVSYIHSGLRF
jgi:hypothetical protein